MSHTEEDYGKLKARYDELLYQRNYLGRFPHDSPDEIDNGHLIRWQLDNLESRRAKSGHSLMVINDYRNVPVCIYHNKVSVISEHPDEIGCNRYYCIDCLLLALYEQPYKERSKQYVKIIEDAIDEMNTSKTFKYYFSKNKKAAKIKTILERVKEVK